MFSITPLSFDDPSPGNPREYPHKPYIARSHWATYSMLTVWVYLQFFIQIFVVGSERRMCFETQCVMARMRLPIGRQ